METNIILNGDCIEHMKQMEENLVDAIITDPPYGLEFMGKDWDKAISNLVIGLVIGGLFYNLRSEDMLLVVGTIFTQLFGVLSFILINNTEGEQ